MRWQVTHSQPSNLIIELPDHIPAEQNFSIHINGRHLTARWSPQLAALCLIDPQTGVESLLKTRSSQFQRFAGEAEVKAHLEFVGGPSQRPQLFTATLQRYVPGQEARAKNAGSSATNIRSPMAGKVLKVLVKDGDKVETGQPLLIIEAMKMENKIFATTGGTVKGLKTKEQAQVTPGQQLLAIV